MTESRRSFLTRDDIVGKRIRRVYRSEWMDDTIKHFTWSEVFIELDDGIIFCLEPLIDPFCSIPIPKINRSERKLVPADEEVNRECRERIIVEAVVGLAMGFGLLLDGGYILYAGTTPSGRIGPVVKHVSSEDVAIEDYEIYKWPKAS